MENIKIENIPINDRPRERLINNGPESLSNEEILSIILNSGTKDISVKNLSSMILCKVRDLSRLKDLTYYDLINIKGIGMAKACTLLSAIELSKRMNRKYDNLGGIKLNDPSKVFDFYKSKINNLQEKVFCIYLDSNKKVIRDKLLFIGTVNHSLVHPRDIFKEAYKLNACYIICVHNHPSGNVSPSLDDINMTNRLSNIGTLMGVKLVDHIIVSENNYYSFLENGKI